MDEGSRVAATPDTVCWGYFDAQRAPVARIRSGDEITIETVSGDISQLPPDGFHILPEHRPVLDAVKQGPGPHLLTGPVHVEGAMPGDVLALEILDVQLRQDWGFMVVLPLLGTLPDDFPQPHMRHVRLDRARGIADLPWGGTLPLRPFFGIMGVAPPPVWGRVTSIIPRAFGGNLDNKDLGPGATLYLPVFNEGALLTVGDGHGVQGHGEVCLTAIETALTGRFRATVRKDMHLAMPRAETATHYMTMAFDEDLDTAMRAALRDMIAWIVAISGISAPDAYMLCSLAADLHVTQTVNVHKGIHCMLPKAALPGMLPKAALPDVSPKAALPRARAAG